MTLILDAAPLVALADRNDPLRPAIRSLLNAESGPLILPAPVATEVDYLLGQRFGRSARRAFLADIASARFLVACLEQANYQLVLAYDERYADLDVGLADLSVVVIAHRFSTKRILTLDQRHFRALRPLDGEHFILLPFDADVPAT